MFKDLGDFQTPPALVSAVLHCLTRTGQSWSRVLEPTCGHGNFIKGVLNIDPSPREIWGIELQNTYVKYAQNAIQHTETTSISIKQANLFDIDLRHDLAWKTSGPLLIVGNPPWITNSALGSLESKNMPLKSNFKGLNGFEAMTGGSNFDIAEYILLKLIWELSPEHPTIALLCKTSVARNILQFSFKAGLPIDGAIIRRIDSKKFFGAFVDACLFCFEVGSEHPSYQAEVYDDLLATEPSSVIGMIDGRLVANMEMNRKLCFLDGTCSLTWRQGIKHDAAAVMELTYDTSGNLYNKLGGMVDVESEYVYPLLKSSNLGGVEKTREKKAMIVPQKCIGEDTAQLEYTAPLLWRYLTQHRDIFDRRKSSIYEKQPSFAIFGVGPYTFAPYKVAISGMYKSLQFRIIGPVNGKPMIFDDTCYFVPCSSAQQAALISSLLQDPVCLDFLRSIIFWDAKRPITKKLLQRIDLKALLQYVERQNLLLRANSELQRIECTESGRQAKWPDYLESFLETYSVAAEKREQIVQDRLFDNVDDLEDTVSTLNTRFAKV